MHGFFSPDKVQQKKVLSSAPFKNVENVEKLFPAIYFNLQ